MFLNLEKLFPGTKAGKSPVVLIALRNLVFNGQHIAKDTEFEVPHDEVAIFGSDARRKNPMEKTKFIDPTPERPAAKPAPEAWGTLPKCFTRWHDIQEELRTAREHVDLIREKRIKLFGTASDLPGPEDGVSTVLSLRMRDPQPRENTVIYGGPLDMTDPETHFKVKRLTQAALAAEDYLKRLRETRSLELQRLFLEVSSERLKVAEELKPMVEELAELGLKIFACRVAGLGLSEYHVRRLYCGSADWHRFNNHPGPCLGGHCILRTSPAGVIETYLDAPVPTSATYLLRERERVKDLRPLLDQTRKELASAEKTLAA